MRSYVDAWKEEEGEWQIKKFDETSWQRRFAHVVAPTYNIADYLLRHSAQPGGLTDAEGLNLRAAIENSKSSQYWRWLPGVATDLEEVSRQMARMGGSKLIEEIAYAEQLRKSSRHPEDWQFSALLYDFAGRYKDMENALKTAYSLVCGDFEGTESMVWRWRRTIGMLYFAAYCNAKRKQEVVVLGTIPSSVTPESLLYTIEEVSALAVETLKAAAEDAKHSNLVQEAEMQEIETTITACETP